MCVEIKKRNYKILKIDQDNIEGLFDYINNNDHFTLQDVQNGYEDCNKDTIEHLFLVCISLLSYFIMIFYLINFYKY